LTQFEHQQSWQRIKPETWKLTLDGAATYWTAWA